MELGIQPLRNQGDGGGNTSTFDGENGIDENGDLWVNGVKAKVITKKPRWSRAGSLSSVHTRSVTGDQRDMGAGIGGSVNTEHKRGLIRSLEDIATNFLDNSKK